MANTPALKDLSASIQQLITTVATLSTNVTTLTAKVDVIEKKLDTIEALQGNVNNLRTEVDKMKIDVNAIEQDSKACLVRVSGLSVSDAEMQQHGYEKAIIKKVYDKLVKPILSAAKNNGDIDSVPTMLNVIEQGYIASRGAKDKQGRALPPILGVRFTNRYLRNTVMRLRRDHMPSPSDAEKTAGIQRYYISEDLTVDAARKVKELRENEKVDRVWTIDGRIRFTLKGDSAIIKLSSPYVSFENAIQKK
jgi:outer membrane murein-binding lipoprotein Lpp